MTPALHELLQEADFDWKARAACRGMPDDLFFPIGDREEEKTATALSICAQCPVREECLEYALETNQRDGIWGGTTEKERRSLRRRRLAERKRAV